MSDVDVHIAPMISAEADGSEGALLPPGYLERLDAELDRRLLLLAEATASARARALTLEASAADVTLFFDDWLWTYDPRLVNFGFSPTIPFTLRPKQREYLAWLEARERHQEDGLVEKSRDEGFSFLTLGFMLHRWLFKDGWAGAVGSRKQDLVDAKDDPKALLPKFRLMLYELPAFFLPEGYTRKESDNFLRITNPETGSSITGEAGDNMGRGGRASLYMIDEWAFVEHPEEVERATSQNSNVRIKGSTPNGVGNRFYQDRFSGKVPVFTFHWKDNPDKNWTEERKLEATGETLTVYPWYERQKNRLDPVTLAQEVDIDYTASAKGIVIPAKWVRAAVGYPLKRGAVNASGYDGSEDGDDSVYANRQGGVVTRLLRLEGTHTAKGRELVRLCEADGVGALYYDRLGVGAGTTATVKEKEDALPFRVVGVANSENPSTRQFEDQPKVPADERFDNWAAEAWWALRIRFWKTYQRATGEATPAQYPDDECVSLPNDSASGSNLVAQLSQPTYSKTSADKIRVDKYGEGTASPNHAEAVLYAFATAPPKPPPIRRPTTRVSGSTLR